MTVRTNVDNETNSLRAVPNAVFIFGADIKTAGTASLLVSLPTVAVGVLRYRAVGGYAAPGSVRHVGLPMARGSLAGAMLGAGLVGWVDVRVLKAVLAVVLAVFAHRLWRTRHLHPVHVSDG